MDVTFGLSALATLLAMVDPVGTVPIFLSLTPAATSAQRRRIARRAVTVALAVMILFAVAGQPLLRILRVSIPAFQISGGLLLFLIAVDMLFARRSGARETPEEEADALARHHDVSIFPLAIPTLSGPGTIAATVLLMGQASGEPVRVAMVAAAMIVTMSVTWLVLRAAETVSRVLGVTGIHVLSRLMGILLSALAVQMILDGIRAARLLG
ncbi:MAG: MarC family protein [Armatimonadota bacterium]|nr:MarC family protein [Armatimonadota bacterium]MDR7436718.1 MarC family protein [Armatimonadota bacterium]MDR7471210.1 MarC family protein [Armatimonadota bacterium]MDR7507346.1 MarC family protein [Armatimonadota bacterium]MDR7509713.1 MarC family protein [Armatimonadota bacterium]